MQIIVKGFNGKNGAVIAHGSMKVLEFQHKVAEKFPEMDRDAMLVYAGKQLDSEQTLEYYKLQDGSTVHIMTAVDGGVQ